MENLIRISDKGLVSAKELYLGLGLNKTNWSRWYPKNIQSNEFFKENIDWIGVRHNDEGNETMDFAISIEFAKHIAMMAKTEKSHEYRNYFIKCENKLKEDKPQCIEDLIILQAQSLKDLRLQLEETKEQTTAVKQEVQNMKDVITINPSEEWRKKTNILINRICMKSKNYEGIKKEIYKALDERAGSDINKRLKNMRARVLLNGGTQTQANKLNLLDVIANDKKLIEIYVAIVKDIAIKNSIVV